MFYFTKNSILEVIKKYCQIILVLIPVLIGCRDYNSDSYISIENKAINDIIFDMIEFESIMENNSFDTENLKLLLLSSLDTSISMIFLPERRGYTVSINNVRLSDEEIQKNKQKYIEGLGEYNESLNRYKNEKYLFSPIRDGTMKPRILDFEFKKKAIKIELVPESKIDFSNLKKNELGFLSISRIYFNRRFDRGYLSYGFFCGAGCAWDNNVEIIKLKGKWKIAKYYSGGIA